jgi:palmitoyltransferase
MEQRNDDLSINVSSGLGFTSDMDMHNRCCSGRFWCIQDICGIICVVLTWFLILYSMFVSFFVILIPAISTHTVFSVFNLILFMALSSLAFISHVRTMLTDPVSYSYPGYWWSEIYLLIHVQGAVPRGNATKEMIQRMGLQQGQVIFKCQKCCSIKPERAHHCSVCQR